MSDSNVIDFETARRRKHLENTVECLDVNDMVIDLSDVVIGTDDFGDFLIATPEEIDDLFDDD